MADDLDKLLEDRAAADESDVDALLDARASAPEPATEGPSFLEEQRAESQREALKKFGKPEELPWYEKAATGFLDPVVGLGQFGQHIIPDVALNAVRKYVVDPAANALFGGDVDTSNTSNSDFDKGVRNREAAYKAARTAAGEVTIDPETGEEKAPLDWWRIAGNVANPVSWYSPVKGGAGLKELAKAGAKSGAYMSLLQPVNSSGNFVYDKSVQGILGTVFGGGLGGAMGAVSPLISKASSSISAAFNRGNAAQQTQAAGAAVDDVLRNVGADPARVDPAIRRTMQQEVLEAKRFGVDPDPIVMTNRADAEALPVPVYLTRGMANRDAIDFSLERNKAGIQGLGEPIADAIKSANRALVQNMDELGAKNARTTFDFSQQAIAKIKEIDDGLQKGIETAYGKVRDSAGRPAQMDAAAFQRLAKENLDGQQFFLLADELPPSVAKAYNAIATGQQPLTVDIAMALDKAWTSAQRSSVKDSEKLAIGQLKRALMQTPVSGQLGQEALAGYQAAKALAKQRFDLIESAPAYKKYNDDVLEPDKFFQTFIEKANVSDIQGLKQLLGPDLTKAAQNTMVRQLKKAAIGPSTDENAIFGQANYNRLLQDEVSGPRIREVFKEAPDVLGHLYRIGRVAENVVKAPLTNTVNRSNTTPAAINLANDMARSQNLGTIGGLLQMGREYAARQSEKRAVQEIVKPGVTQEPLRRPAPKRLTVSDLLGGTAGAVAPEREE